MGSVKSMVMILESAVWVTNNYGKNGSLYRVVRVQIAAPSRIHHFYIEFKY